MPGVAVLGGDVHAHHVAQLKTDFDDPRGALVGSEFCSSSISSRGRDQRTLDAALPLHPHMLLARVDQRGTMAFDIDTRELRARVMTVDQPADPNSPVRVLARYVVDAA